MILVLAQLHLVAIAYRAFIDQRAHKDQLAALAMLITSLIIAYAPEILSRASDTAGTGGKIVNIGKVFLKERQFQLSLKTVNVLSSVRAKMAATVISIFSKSANPETAQKINDFGK